MLQESMAAHTVPVPEYPVLHVHVMPESPVDAQVAFGSHPPLAVAQEAGAEASESSLETLATLDSMLASFPAKSVEPASCGSPAPSVAAASSGAE
jgi:hypothetical protein